MSSRADISPGRVSGSDSLEYSVRRVGRVDEILFPLLVALIQIDLNSCGKSELCPRSMSLDVNRF